MLLACICLSRREGSDLHDVFTYPNKLDIALFWQVEKAPLESYADVGGLEQQIQEIKEAVELPLTHPEVYEDIGIKPPKVDCFGIPESLSK